MTTRWLMLWGLLAFAAPGQSRAASYDYPFVDAYAATVVGTPSIYQAQLPARVPLEEHVLTVFKDRRIPDIFWYARGLRFGFLPQAHKAPLAFVIGGTGADYDSSKSMILIRMFQKIGFHVISLPSPIHQNFIVNASTTSMPGLITDDAADLYRVMRLAYAQVQDRIEVTGFDLTGYSLGGAQAAFVAKLDDQPACLRLSAGAPDQPAGQPRQLGGDPGPPARGQHAARDRHLHQSIDRRCSSAPPCNRRTPELHGGSSLRHLQAPRAPG